MSHLNWPGFRHRDPARSTAGATAGRRHPHVRSLTAALFSSLCLISCFSAAAQASPQAASNLADRTQSTTTVAAADTIIGGFKFVPHLLYDEVKANRNTTSTIANANSGPCDDLGAFGLPGTVLKYYCKAQITWWASVARNAQAQGRCFRVVIPAHNANWAYPSSYTGDWCS